MPNHPRSIQMVNLDGLSLPGTGSPRARVEAMLRRAILAGNLAPGARLPSSRMLARDLAIARGTVEQAFDLLAAEGFLVRRRGSGTFVAAAVPERERLPVGVSPMAARGSGPPLFSRRGDIIAAYPGHRTSSAGTAFTPSVPALDLFPRQVWSRLMSRATAQAGPDLLAAGASNGLPELRRAVAAHVAGSRAVACSPDQVVITTSAHQAVDLVTRVLLDPGDPLWVEDPGYPPMVQLFRAGGARVCPVPVDADGFDVDRALQIEPGARLAYVTPSHQYPGGGLMTLERRHALLDWAVRERGWIIEDDYDGELRYTGRPLASLQGLDAAGRVIYVGTFNKMMYPALRLAFLVAPAALVDACLAAKHLMDGQTHGHSQAALARFIEDGHLATHLRRITGEYDSRRRALLAALEPLSDRLVAGPSEAGLHLTAWLRHEADDRRIAAACAAQGVDLHPLSRFYQQNPRPGFVLGFACSRPARTRAAMPILARALE